MSKIYLTESELKQIVESATKQILNEKQQLDEWNTYKVDFKNLGDPANPKRAGIGGNYWNNNRTQRLLANGTYGRNRMVDMGSVITDLKDLGYSNEQIQQGIDKGFIRLANRQGNTYNSRRKQNRKTARLMTKAGGILGTGTATQQASDDSTDTSGADTTPAIEPKTITKKVYFKSPEVGQIQELLNNKYGAGLSVDNTCGPLTINAILNALQHPNPEVDNMREKTKADQENAQVSTGTQQTVKTATDNAASKIDMPQQNVNIGNTGNNGQKMPSAGDMNLNAVQMVQQQMSSVFNNKTMSPEQKINSIKVAFNNAKTNGGLTKAQLSQLKQIMDKYINGLKA